MGVLGWTTGTPVLMLLDGQNQGGTASGGKIKSALLAGRKPVTIRVFFFLDCWSLLDKSSPFSSSSAFLTSFFPIPLSLHSHSIWPMVLGALLSLPNGLSSRRDLPPAIVAGVSRAVLTAWRSLPEGSFLKAFDKGLSA